MSTISSSQRRKGHCNMRGQCGKTSIFSPDLPCALEEAKAEEPSEILRKSIIDVCGEEFGEGPVCCTQDQVDNLRLNLEQAEPLISACPACRNNFRGLFCSMTCNGDQSQFLDIIKTQKTKEGGADGDIAVKEVNFWVGDEWKESFYNSCKDVKFGPGNSFAIELLGGGAKNADQLLKYLGDERPLIGSPFQINFPHDKAKEGKELMWNSNLSTIASPPQPYSPPPRNCNDPDLLSRCACTDCPAVCAALPPAEAPRHGEICSIPLPGGARLPCFTLLVIIIYFAGVAVAILGQNKKVKRAMIRHRNSGISVRSEGSGYERVRMGTEETDEQPTSQQHLIGASADTSDDASNGRGRGLFSGFMGNARSDGEASPAAAGAWALSASQPRSYTPSVILSRFFYRIGRKCASAPYLTFAIALVLIAIANIGWTKFSVETDPIRLWVSPDSEARHRKSYFDEEFGPFYRTQQVFVMDESAAPLSGQRTLMEKDEWEAALQTTSPALNWQRLEWWADVEAAVRNLTTKDGISLKDVCFAPSGPGGPCVVQSVMGYFNDDLASAGLNKDNWKDSLDRCASTPAECLPVFGQPLKRNIILGGLPTDSAPSNARSLVTTWVLANSLDADAVERAHQWELALEELLFSIAGINDAPLNSLGQRREVLGLVMSLNTESSLEQELSRAGNTDVVIVVLSYLVMFLYASLTLGSGGEASSDDSSYGGNQSFDARSRPSGSSVRSGFAGRLLSMLPGFRGRNSNLHSRNRRLAKRFLVQSKFSLGLFGILVVLASVSAAVGVWSALGVKVTLVIVEVLPFLLLAVGVDNIFLLADEMDRQNALASKANPYSRGRLSTDTGLNVGIDAVRADNVGDLDEEDEDEGEIAAAAAAAYGTRAPRSRSGAFNVSAAERAARTLSRVGPSILLSASVQVCAFLLGATIPMPAVRHFALYAAASMTFAALLQCTVFVAAMALDADRVEADRIDCLPCLRLPTNTPIHSTLSTSEYSGLVLGSTQGMKGEGWLGRTIRRSYAPTLIKPKVKFFVLALFAASFALSCIGVRNVKMGLDQRLALPKGSYLRDYFDAVDSFLDVGPPVYFVARDVDVTTRAGQQAICGRFTTCHPLSLANTLEGERNRPNASFIAEPASSWIDDFFQWLNPTLESCCRVKNSDPTQFCKPSDSEDDCQPCFANRTPAWNITLDGMPEGEEFMRYLHQWLISPTDAQCPLGGQAAYSASLAIDPETDRIITSHFRTFHTPLRSQADFIDALRATERISANVKEASNKASGGSIGVESLDVYAYAVYVPFFDQYLYLDRLAVQLLGGALLAIVGVTTLLLGSLRTALILALCVSNAVFCVSAVMGVLGIGLNALTLVNLGVCAAICVEFCAHVARAFMRAPGSLPRHHALAQRERDDRTWAALVDVGPSVISGITGTKLVGISVLFWAQSDILKLYYASLWFALILIGAVHGLVFLPVILSIFGGRGYASGDDEAEVSRRLRRAHDSAEFRPFAADVEAEESEDEYY
ncbi:hypothetical protein L7F22_018992 [Adiantum nelumboides]|nr:hypothetical protein [Adiantum nelumboides]